jgi:hypothetical protein
LRDMRRIPLAFSAKFTLASRRASETASQPALIAAFESRCQGRLKSAPLWPVEKCTTRCS